jgi:hypothetical protein
MLAQPVSRSAAAQINVPAALTRHSHSQYRAGNTVLGDRNSSSLRVGGSACRGPLDEPRAGILEQPLEVR